MRASPKTESGIHPRSSRPDPSAGAQKQTAPPVAGVPKAEGHEHHLLREQIVKDLAPLPVSWLWGAGPKT